MTVDLPVRIFIDSSDPDELAGISPDLISTVSQMRQKVMKKYRDQIEMKMVRFRTLGCYPLTGGVESDAETLDEIIDETLAAVSSERTSRVIDNEAAGSMERRKREGYF